MSTTVAPTAHEETVHGAGHRHPADRDYVWVALFLGVVTGAEVAMSYIDVTSKIVIPVLLVMMVVKFAVVIMWFMHLRFDSKMFTGMFLAGLLLAVAVYIAFLTSMQVFGEDRTTEPRPALGPPATATALS